MKADQRKQPAAPVAPSHRLGEWWQNTTDTRKSSTIWVVAAVVVLVIVLIVAWRYFAGESRKGQASVWKQLEQASSVKDLESIVETNRGTDVGRVAKAQLARALLNDGLAKLGSESQRSKAIADVDRARSLYTELAAEARDDAMLRREALLGAAKAEEALVAVPKADNPGESRGSLDRALELYDQTAQQFEKTPQGQEAAERAKVIRENKASIQQFYEDFAKSFIRGDTQLPPRIDGPTPELKPKESTPPEPKPGETKPAEPTTPLAPPPGETKKPDEKSADPNKPLVPPPGESTPKDTKPVDPKPGETKPAPPPVTPPKDPAQPMPPKTESSDKTDSNKPK